MNPTYRGGLTNPPPASASASDGPSITASRFAPSPQRHTVSHFIGGALEKRISSTEADALAKRIARAISYYPALALPAYSCPVEWNAGLKSSAGRFVVDHRGARIELHPGLRQEAPQATVDTLLHELAHAMAWWCHRRDCGHDVRWYEMMFLLALDPLTHRTHDLPHCRRRSAVELSLADLEHDLALEAGDTP